ncbi:ABC transporter B family member 20 [Carica papaya]|uniref:ABC transporter B family member 20 n=1 Tax=Carica papaya TaxID=3649 RepID=UPI000B8C9D99|nr:ABC transporter B family member 20 [Carica papaya]
MVVGSLAAAAHGTALVVYLHYFAKIVQVLGIGSGPSTERSEEQFERFMELALIIVYIAVGVFVAGWIEVSCWILTGERQTAVIRSRYVQVLLNQDMSFFDTYGNNGDIVSQVLSDVLLIQSALSEKVGNYIHNMATFFSGLVIGFVNCWQIALITLATGPFIVAAGGISNIFLHRLAENIQDAYAEAASIAEQAVSYIRTLYAFTNETLAKYSYATSLQATLRYGIMISLVQGLGLGFTYGLAICSCALQLWVGRFLVTHHKVHGGEIITALFAVILSGLGLNQAATNFYSFDQGRIAAYRLFEMISRSSSAANQEGITLSSVQGNIEFRNVYFSYLSRPEIPILSGFYLTVPAKRAVALVGRNGSGKSSIIPLMERFYDPTLGSLAMLPKLDVQSAKRQKSNGSDPESPISPLLTSDPKNERSHSQTFSRPHSHSDDVPVKVREVKGARNKEAPSFWRLAELSFAEWLYAVLGSIGAAIFGSFNPLLAYVISLIVTAYYRGEERHHLQQEVDKWCLIIACMGLVTVVANFLQHFYFGIMGEKMTERVRRMMFSAMLRNEVGWFDEEENSADTLSMRLANDATFVRAAFSTGFHIYTGQNSGLLDFQGVSILSQKKASLVLEDAVRNIYTVVAFCAGNKVMELYRLQLKIIFRQSFLHGMAIGFAFGFSQFLLFACNALLLWYTAISVKNGHTNLPTALKEYMVFSFATFALVEPFGLAPYILKRRKSLTSVFEIIDRVPRIEPDDNSALKPPNVYGSIELKNVDFCYPTRLEVLVLSNFSLKVNGGQTVAVVGVSGSGKSTIISLIERFYDPVAGQVLLDGRDLKLYNLRWLRNHLGLVQQEPIMFSTTIRENIIYARHNASEAEMKEAARIANAHHFISSLPHGYDTHVGMRGVDLTPGQKQRIAIARVVLKNAPILLLDEASSSIESESSRVVQEALDTLIMGNKTTILIAHRAAMMRHVDNIVVLNGGRIVEEGTHDSLVAKNGLYVRLMQPHFGKGLRQHRLV